MPFERPTLAALVGRIKADLRGSLGIAGPLVRRAMADVLSVVWSGAVHSLHGRLSWLADQILADKSERPMLLRQAGLYGITPNAASFAAGTVTATGTDGSQIVVGTVLQFTSGLNYRTTAPAVIAGGVATVPVKATSSGEASNVPAGEALTFESPTAGVEAAATVDGPNGIADGFDQEPTEGTRARLLLRLREPPEGGADHDYEAWTLTVPGITRVWVYPVELGLGTVVVRFVLDEQTPSILPDGATVAAVQAELEAERPITAEVTAEAPTLLAVPFTIALNPDTAQTRANVTAELADLFFREAAPGSAVDPDYGKVKLSHIRQAIGAAADDYTLTVPSADVAPAAGQLSVVGVITWV